MAGEVRFATPGAPLLAAAGQPTRRWVVTVEWHWTGPTGQVRRAPARSYIIEAVNGPAAERIAWASRYDGPRAFGVFIVTAAEISEEGA